MPLPTPTPLPIPARGGRLVLYGGSFDPPHRAHLYFARFLLDRFPDSALLMVPAARSPHKSSGPSASPEQRCEMLRLGLLDVGLHVPEAAGSRARVGIWTDEIDRSGEGEPSFWVDTLRRARSLVPSGLTLSFVIGSDQLAAFDRWREPHEILRLARPLVLVRGGGMIEDGAPVDEAMCERLMEPIRHARTPSPDGGETPTWSDCEQSLFGAGLLMGQPTMAISSTLIRELLRARAESPDLDQMLTPSVLEYVRREKPYV